jgi:hypothetical protein
MWKLENGEAGIRTRGALRHNGFRDRPIQPLWHLSDYFQKAQRFFRHRRPPAIRRAGTRLWRARPPR